MQDSQVISEKPNIYIMFVHNSNNMNLDESSALQVLKQAEETSNYGSGFDFGAYQDADTYREASQSQEDDYWIEKTEEVDDDSVERYWEFTDDLFSVVVEERDPDYESFHFSGNGNLQKDNKPYGAKVQDHYTGREFTITGEYSPDKAISEAIDWMSGHDSTRGILRFAGIEASDERNLARHRVRSRQKRTNPFVDAHGWIEDPDPNTGIDEAEPAYDLI